ncbi:unnamed protein product, partial [marine sediment metagenome]
MAEQTVELAPGESKVVSFEATPQEAKVYQVSVDGLSGSFKAVEAVPELITFSVEVYNIPSHAAGSYQWYIDYGGKKHGMIDPQAGIWTPIAAPITVANVPPVGQLRVTLMAGPYEAWTFSAGRTFRDGEAYRFNLAAEIIEGPGIVLTNLVISPSTANIGESVTISVIATNPTDISESRGVTFTIGSIVEVKTVSLEPGESKKLSITVTPEELGAYAVRVDELSGSFNVIAVYPGYITLMNLDINPKVVEATPYYWNPPSKSKAIITGLACIPATIYGEWY